MLLPEFGSRLAHTASHGRNRTSRPALLLTCLQAGPQPDLLISASLAPSRDIFVSTGFVTLARALLSYSAFARFSVLGRAQGGSLPPRRRHPHHLPSGRRGNSRADEGATPSPTPLPPQNPRPRAGSNLYTRLRPPPPQKPTLSAASSTFQARTARHEGNRTPSRPFGRHATRPGENLTSSRLSCPIATIVWRPDSYNLVSASSVVRRQHLTLGWAHSHTNPKTRPAPRARRP